jgi:RNA polymerase sigma factor (sigma-70 family)
MSANQTTQIQRFLDRLRAGDARAQEELLRLAGDRLHQLTRQMRKTFRIPERWADTDDVFQNAQLRLWQALQSVVPESPRHFLNLAALEIRRELIDLARHLHRASGPGNHEINLVTADNSLSYPPDQPAPSSLDPAQLALWTDFHGRASALPEPAREVVHLVYYCGLSKPEAAEVMGIGERTLYRHWNEAWNHLVEVLECHGRRIPS